MKSSDRKENVMWSAEQMAVGCLGNGRAMKKWLVTGFLVAIVLSALATILPARAEAANRTYGSYILRNDPAVYCATRLAANGTVDQRKIFVMAPEMYSYSSFGMGSNTHSFQPVLWEYVGSRWVVVLNGLEYRGGAGIFGLPQYGEFNILRPGIFAATIVLRWYSGSGTKLDEVHVNTESNYQRYRMFSNGQTQFLPSTSGYCQMT
jgi:hypothetical protein